MKKYRFNRILQSEGWLTDVTVTLNDLGIILSIDQNHDGAENIDGVALPGFQNAHSHAFQYAMAGLAENHPKANESDDFWSWRETMYRLALTISPDQLEAIAAMLYSEMVRHGYTHVAEFHYLHHDKGGQHYSNKAEHGERLIAAAKSAGIKITLVPMFYQRGGFDQGPQEQQRRFISKSIDDYLELWNASEKATLNYQEAAIAYGIHSLRAIEPELVNQIIGSRHLSGPFHIHVSEQLREIEDSIRFLGQRPVEWLLGNADIDENCHLVHATHLSKSEIEGIAKSGALVVLCPSTEGNLGDGIFPLKEYQDQGGKWSIGTDSHIGLNPCEELRWLDYGQRLISHKRNTFGDNSGAIAFNQALTSGRAAMGNKSKVYFEIGKPFDAVVYDSTAPLMSNCLADNLLSTIIYASDPSFMTGTMVNGEWIVKKQQHINLDGISENFNRAIKQLGIR